MGTIFWNVIILALGGNMCPEIAKTILKTVLYISPKRRYGTFAESKQ